MLSLRWICVLGETVGSITRELPRGLLAAAGVVSWTSGSTGGLTGTGGRACLLDGFPLEGRADVVAASRVRLGDHVFIASYSESQQGAYQEIDAIKTVVDMATGAYNLAFLLEHLGAEARHDPSRLTQFTIGLTDETLVEMTVAELSRDVRGAPVAWLPDLSAGVIAASTTDARVARAKGRRRVVPVAFESLSADALRT